MPPRFRSPSDSEAKTPGCSRRRISARRSTRRRSYSLPTGTASTTKRNFASPARTARSSRSGRSPPSTKKGRHSSSGRERENRPAGDSDGKDAIEPGIGYRIAFETEDALGRIDRGEARATCDILVIKDGDRYKVRVSDIIFPSDSWELSPKESRKLLEANRKTLDRIATLFTRFPDYSLTVEGYANAVYWGDEKKLAEEQKRELLPLSQKRADTVKAALVMLGIDEGRITAKGLGGTKPVADFGDAQSAWKNRRVEFILEKR